MISFKLFKHFARSPLSTSLRLKFPFTTSSNPEPSPPTSEATTENNPAETQKTHEKTSQKSTPFKKTPKTAEVKKEEEIPESLKFSKTSEITLEKLRKMKQRFAVTKDLHRVDLGLVIDRPAIFLHFSDQEMENMKYRNNVDKKYKTFPLIPPELIDFQLDRTGVNLNISHIQENLKTHSRKLEDGTEEYYCEHSRLYFQVDPNVQTPKSIQRSPNYKVYLLVKNKENGEWEFPSFYVLESEKFVEARAKYFGFLSNNNWSVYHYPVQPFVFRKREFTNEEKQDPRNKRLKGVKTFYFAASHAEGVIEINPRLYSDYAWVSKLEMNQYLTRENYFTFIHSLVLY